MGVNRYSKPVQPAQFNPLSFQEIAYLPATLDKRHNQQEAKYNELLAAEPAVSSYLQDEMNTLYGPTKKRINDQATRLATSGVRDSGLRREASLLNRDMASMSAPGSDVNKLIAYDASRSAYMEKSMEYGLKNDWDPATIQYLQATSDNINDPTKWRDGSYSGIYAPNKVNLDTWLGDKMKQVEYTQENFFKVRTPQEINTYLVEQMLFSPEAMKSAMLEYREYLPPGTKVSDFQDVNGNINPKNPVALKIASMAVAGAYNRFAGSLSGNTTDLIGTEKDFNLPVIDSKGNTILPSSDNPYEFNFIPSQQAYEQSSTNVVSTEAAYGSSYSFASDAMNKFGISFPELIPEDNSTSGLLNGSINSYDPNSTVFTKQDGTTMSISQFGDSYDQAYKSVVNGSTPLDAITSAFGAIPGITTQEQATEFLSTDNANAIQDARSAAKSYTYSVDKHMRFMEMTKGNMEALEGIFTEAELEELKTAEITRWDLLITDIKQDAKTFWDNFLTNPMNTLFDETGNVRKDKLVNELTEIMDDVLSNDLDIQELISMSPFIGTKALEDIVMAKLYPALTEKLDNSLDNYDQNGEPIIDPTTLFNFKNLGVKLESLTDTYWENITDPDKAIRNKMDTLMSVAVLPTYTVDLPDKFKAEQYSGGVSINHFGSSIETNRTAWVDYNTGEAMETALGINPGTTFEVIDIDLAQGYDPADPVALKIRVLIPGETKDEDRTVTLDVRPAQGNTPEKENIQNLVQNIALYAFNALDRSESSTNAAMMYMDMIAPELRNEEISYEFRKSIKNPKKDKVSATSIQLPAPQADGSMGVQNFDIIYLTDTIHVSYLDSEGVKHDRYLKEFSDIKLYMFNAMKSNLK